MPPLKHPWPFPPTARHWAIALLGILLLPVGASLVAGIAARPLLPSFGRLQDILPEMLVLVLLVDLALRLAPPGRGRWSGAIQVARRAVRRWGPLALACLPLLLNIAHLSGQWRGVDPTNGFALGGYLPLSDAQGYACGAARLAHTGCLNEYAARRPLGATLPASLLWLVRNDFTSLLAAQTLLVSLAMGAAVLGVGRLAGLFPAFLYAILQVFAYRACNGMVMTETTGALLGNLSFCAFLAALRDGDRRPALAGLTLLTLALLARSGAMLVLPALLAWIVLRERSAGWPSMRRTFLLASLCIASTLALNRLAYSQLKPPGEGSQLMGDAPHYVYNFTLRETQPWDYANRALPALADPALNDRERSRIILAAAADNVMGDPLGFLARAVLRYATRWRDLFVQTVLFQLPFPKSWLLPPFLAALAAPWLLPTPRARHLAALLLTVVLGSYLSLPFLTLDYSRIFSATLPFTNAALALGAATWLAGADRLGGKPRDDAAMDALVSPVVFQVGLLLATLMVLVLPLAFSLRPAPANPPSPIPGDTPFVQLSRTPHLVVIPDGERAGPGRIHRQATVRPPMPLVFRNLEPGALIASAWTPTLPELEYLLVFKTPPPPNVDSLAYRMDPQAREDRFIRAQWILPPP